MGGRGGGGRRGKGSRKRGRKTTHAHERRSSDAAFPAPALCSAMSGELAGCREGGRGKVGGGGGG